MNQAYPYPIPNSQSNVAAFVANSTLVLGTYVKPLDARTLISVDYSKLTPSVTLASYVFKISPGGAPPLWIDSSALDGTNTMLTFYISGGIGGRAYELTINAKLADGEVRSDTLTVNVLGDDCDCVQMQPPPLSGAVTADGSIIVNVAPRFFVSGTPPVGANVLDRWYNTTDGNVYDYISTGVGAQWALAGTTISGGGGGGGGGSVNIFALNPITPDGAATTFTLSMLAGPVTISGAETLFVSVDGVWQQPGVQYTASSNKIIFTQAPSADSIVFILWFAPASAGS